MRKFFLLVLGILSSAFVASSSPAGAGGSILVDKGAFMIHLLSKDGEKVMSFPVATGINPGRKKAQGDCKTPEGTFTVTWVQNTRGVMYDYHDGKGKVEAYGPFFIHLETPGFKAIGIHGTCPERDDRIGTRDSQGCVRLHNADLLKLIPHVYKGMKVEIIPGPEDMAADKPM